VVLPGSSDPNRTRPAAPPGVPVLGAVAVRPLWPAGLPPVPRPPARAPASQQCSAVMSASQSRAHRHPPLGHGSPPPDLQSSVGDRLSQALTEIS
jgi:hypothetical protein